MIKECITCDRHRKALADKEAKEKVACSYWSKHGPKLMQHHSLKEAWFGWANLTCRPGQEGKGYLTNNCIIVNKKSYCDKYKKIRK
ncbi:MAG: hypothetical protein ACOCRX_11775 [Candidatus Woesearchaeota archaeon]